MKYPQIRFPSSLSFFLHFLRGFAAQIVVVGHGLNFSALGAAIRPPNFPYIQNIGVLIFFFLSGIVICFSIHTRIQRGGYGYLEFIFDRAVRFSITIVPCLLFIWALDVWSYGDPRFALFENNASIGQFLGNALMLQNHPWFGVVPFGSGRPLWSVSMEWWTYMFFGFMILLAWTSPKRVILLLPVFILAIPMIQTNFASGRGLVFVWLLGAVSYYFIVNAPRITGRARMLAALALIVWLAPYAFVQLLTMGERYSLQASLAVSVFMGVSFYLVSHLTISGAGLFGRMSKFIAEYSFTLYCVHYTIYEFLVFQIDLRGLPLLLAGFVIANIVAILIARFTEMRYKTYRRWIKDYIHFRPDSNFERAEIGTPKGNRT